MEHAFYCMDVHGSRAIIVPVTLEDITVNSQVRGLVANDTVTIKHVQMFGDQAMEVTYADSTGRTASQLIYRDQEANLELVTQSRPLSFVADGALFRLAAEAHRIRLAYLFDPLIAVNTSNIQPLPHQITAVYETMLGRQPLRFLLADDPGAGKTIMTGLLVKELMIRGDVSKCLIVAPGSLVEQWQDELDQKFGLAFDIMTNDAIAASRTGNWFLEHDLCLCRLDKLSRNEDLQAQLESVDWDLVIVDEAHKMSATYNGAEVKTTKRFRLGRLLSEHTRQLLLLTATPHNGKDEDFQLFLSLLDGDRFEGIPRGGAHTIDAGDLMRRMVKEKLVTMEGKPLFPERFAYTLQFELSDEEAALYEEVTSYVREEFNRADNLENVNRRGTVGFALTILQRRLASSPEAIYQSLRRRRERLEKRLREERLMKRGAEAQLSTVGAPSLSNEEIDDIEDAPEGEMELEEQRVVDLATASLTIAELEAEIDTLRRLEAAALQVRRSGQDMKWQRLADALNENPLMFHADRRRRKLVIFTEHRDTLNYLQERLSTLLGDPEAIVVVHGQIARDQRRALQESFMSNPDVLVFLATDAAGEGINLQRAHLMINYDLPWNPNRLEQRFGRIHRIGQREVCHLWNLVAQNTREGEVYLRLLEKLEEARKALQGQVFDVLGQVFQNTSLREVLIEAIRKGDNPDTKKWLDQVIDEELDQEHLRQLIDERSLSNESLDASRVQEIREMMQRAEARRLQPHYIGAFFAEAFGHLGGRLVPKEEGRFEIRNVPFEVRQRDRVTGRRAPVLKAYERVTFLKERIRVDGKPPAALIAPGHPLLDSVIDLILEKHRELLRQGSVLIDPNDEGAEPRLLLCLESAVSEGPAAGGDGAGRTISRRLQFVELNEAGKTHPAGYAPYLDYQPATPEQHSAINPLLDAAWLGEGIERRAVGFAVGQMVPDHLREVRLRREAHIVKAMQQVHERLTREVVYWNNRAAQLDLQEQAGKVNAKLNASQARQRADTLAERLRARMAKLESEKRIVPLPPTIVGGALVIPAGWFGSTPEETMSSRVAEEPAAYGRPSRETEAAAMAAVMDAERQRGFEPRDVSKENRGYDIESLDPQTGNLRFIEVKGRIAGAGAIMLTRNEVLTALNKPESWFLAVVFVEGGRASAPHYYTEPFREGLQFAAASVCVELAGLTPTTI
jgi:superfamily II DNA or RNA helicase